MTRSFKFACLFSPAFAATVVTAQTTAPSADTTPKSALRDYVKALNDGDEKGIRGLLYTANPVEQRMADDMTDSAVALSQLNKKMVDKFGAPAAHDMMGDPAEMTKMVGETIDSSTEKVDGDSATVVSNESGQGTMNLKKVDGKWKIVVGDMAKGEDPASVQKTLDSVEHGIAIYKEVTADLDGGKLATAEAAKAELDSKMGGPKPGATTMPTAGTALQTPAMPTTRP